MYLDSCMRELKDRECGLNLEGVKVKCLLYADDAVLVASSREELQEMVSCVNSACKDKGMKLNVDKTKVMVFEWDECVTNCGGLEQVKELRYLGSMFWTT
ncbi:reverse transcriptase domain-containing protein [Escherichia coli]